jgi:hypothetical protein
MHSSSEFQPDQLRVNDFPEQDYVPTTSSSSTVPVDLKIKKKIRKPWVYKSELDALQIKYDNVNGVKWHGWKVAAMLLILEIIHWIIK